MSGSSSYDLNTIPVTFADLTGSALGQTNASGITLDTNAAGYNWFIDTTPADNSEFLPTSNPNEWVAKAGSAAAGKMDMLSVLLHEYGHALGINHSADPNDYMGTTLTAGVRRLPNAEEMALMQNLISQAKTEMTATSSTPGNTPTFPTLPLGTSFIGFLGLLRSSRYGGVSIAPDANTLVTQYAWAANTTLVNGSLNAADGWSTQGSVNIGSGAAVMNEVSGSQTRLSQVFLLNPTDRFLSFTLAGTALDDLTGAPDDAFEVALLDANSGASLLGGTGLTRTDAFLNLQADGTQNVANCVTCINNADGSRTYRVDLAGVPAGTAVNLSFDLIGFGGNGSHVTVSDVRLSGLPQLHDDAATMLEDGTLAFNPFAQVDNAAILQLGSHVVDQPAHGAVTVNADGTFVYTPTADYFGTDTFTYRLSDGPLESNLATVSITLTAVNDAPVVADVQATTAEDTALVIALGAYATDVDSASLTTQIVTGPTHGVLTQNADGSYTYTPEANYNGADSFTYKANDGALDSNIATVTLNVTPVNDAPTLNDQSLAAVEDTALAMNLLAAASDIDGDTLTASIVAGAQHGQVTINADGSFTYTPDINFNGVDSFTYKVNDGALDSNIATVTLAVAAVNDAPVAADAAVATQEDSALVLDLRTYASDVDSTVFTSTIVNAPTHGVLTQNADGTYSYTPAANYNGADSFTYLVNDGALDSNIATVTLNVTPVNDAPTLGDLNLAAVEDTALTMNLLAAATDIEGDKLTAAIVATAQHGQLSINADGSFTYTPDLNFNGVDSFTYKVNDGQLDSNIATVTLAIAAVNDAPVAADAAMATLEDTALVIDLRTYASDVDSTAFTARVVTGPAHGVLTQNADGSYTYTPETNYNGADSFTYLVNDGALDSNIATVSLAIASVNDAPVAADAAMATLEDTALVIDLRTYASDVDSTAFAAQVVTGPTHGVLTQNADGSFTYTPDLNFNGADSFTYKVNDGMLDSNIATVTLAVAAVNDAPVAGDLNFAAVEDTALAMNLLAQATDVDGDTLAASIVAGAQHGQVSINADGSFTYTPDLNFNGADSFTYKVNDGMLDSNIATVTLVVAAVNDAPVAADAAVTTAEDTALVIDLRSYATDVDSTAFAAAIVNAPTHGVLVANADGTFSYTPDLNYNGADSFTYLVNDGALDSNIATVSLNVTSVNDAPVAGDLNFSAEEDTALAMNLLAQASDVDGDLLTASIVAGAQHGQVNLNADGSFTYTPDVNYNGTDSFTYKVNDGQLDSNFATVMLNIAAVNDAPVAADAAVNTLEDTSLVIDLRNYATDVDSSVFAAAIVNAPTHGALVANADGTYSYTPDANYNGADSFTYLINDGQLDSNVATVTLAIASVNDAPAAVDVQAAGIEDVPLNLNLLATASDVDGDALMPVIIAGPLHGQLLSKADGTFDYVSDLNYFGTDSFTYKVNDGQLDSNIVTVSLTLAAVNDAPVAVSAMVTGMEDTPYVFTWNDFKVSDVDSADLAITLNTLPANGLLQYFNGLEWVAATVGQRVTSMEIDAGLLCFGPNANESGFSGYSTTGLGNMKANYASFTYQADDGLLSSAVASMTVNVIPVADAPSISLSAAAGASGASAIRFSTSWESVSNRNNKYTLISGQSLDGWRVVREHELGDEYHRDRDHDGDYDEHDHSDDNKEAFVIWSSGDRMKDANDDKRTVQAAQNTGRNWLELGNAMDLERQAYAIERTVTTRAGIAYDLGMDYAGRLGLDINHTRIGIYVDGVQIGSYAGTSANAALNWEALNFSFIGNGSQQRIRIAVEGIATSDHDDHHHEGHGYGAMIDKITLTEILPVNTGYQDSAINLSEIIATLTDMDSSEVLGVTIGAVPTGAILTDGAHAFVGTDAQHLVAVTGWDLANLTIVAPSGFVGSFALTVAATATEASTGEAASYAISLPVTVLPANVSSPLVIDLNGDGVRTTAMADAHARFDLLNNGHAIRSGWISAQDAFLAIDGNRNGIIDDRSELFGGSIGEGYAKLASFDSNRDGLVDARDARFGELNVWQDANGNGLTDAGELRSLSEQGIASLDTNYTVNPEVQGGNWLLERGMVRFSDGHTATMADAYFEVDPNAGNMPSRNSASITLRSEPGRSGQEQPFGTDAISESFNKNLDSNAKRFFEERKLYAPAVIDWGAQTEASSAQSGEEDKKKRKDKSASWLSDFLGVSGDTKQDAASLSKLSVSLKKIDKLDS